MLRRLTALAVIPAVLLMLAACSPTANPQGVLTHQPMSPNPNVAYSGPAAAPTAPTAVQGAPAGVILPDSSRTPGATNPQVTQANIQQTICVSGYTATIRPPASYTTGLKKQQLASGYAYQGDMKTGDYEEDHLISLEIGGSPTSPQNLWPEPYAGSSGAKVKDRIENHLHELVCAGKLSLAAAQNAIATNWWTAYKTYGG